MDVNLLVVCILWIWSTDWWWDLLQNGTAGLDEQVSRLLNVSSLQRHQRSQLLGNHWIGENCTAKCSLTGVYGSGNPIKAKLLLLLLWMQSRQMELEVRLHSFFASTWDGCEWSDLHSCTTSIAKCVCPFFISVTNQLDARNFCFTISFYFMPLHVSSTRAHHQEVKIALHSLWYHRTYRCITQPLVSSHL